MTWHGAEVLYVLGMSLQTCSLALGVRGPVVGLGIMAYGAAIVLFGFRP